MPRKKKEPLDFVEAMRRLAIAGLDRQAAARSKDDPMAPLDERVKDILGIATANRKNRNNMVFFVMYDIESDKVRRAVASYLLKNGCHRIQKSIFLAEQTISTCEQIKSDLAKVQEAYDNKDSIIILPVTTDYLRMMKIIGKEINMDVITKTPNTIFF